MTKYNCTDLCYSKCHLLCWYIDHVAHINHVMLSQYVYELMYLLEISYSYAYK